MARTKPVRRPFAENGPPMASHGLPTKFPTYFQVARKTIAGATTQDSQPRGASKRPVAYKTPAHLTSHPNTGGKSISYFFNGQASKPRKKRRTKRNTVQNAPPLGLSPAKRGAYADHEIRFHQKRNDGNLIPKLTFARLVREISAQFNPEIRWSRDAYAAIQDYTEAWISYLFHDSVLLALHAKRVTVRPCDVKLALQLRGDKLLK